MVPLVILFEELQNCVEPVLEPGCLLTDRRHNKVLVMNLTFRVCLCVDKFAVDLLMLRLRRCTGFLSNVAA